MLRPITAEPVLTISLPRGLPVRLQASTALIPLWAACAGALIDHHPLRGAMFFVVLIVLLYVCGALHELGHIWVARRFGARVTGVRVSGMGAFVRLENAKGITAREDLAIALGGPLVSAALSCGLGWLAVAVGGSRPLAEWPLVLLGQDPASLLLLLAVANVGLTVFNLLPVFPMDGGRALSAGLALFVAPARASQLVAAFGVVMAAAIVPVTLLLTADTFLRLSAVLTAGFVCVLSARQATQH
jgi:Zn-dependent protease